MPIADLSPTTRTARWALAAALVLPCGAAASPVVAPVGRDGGLGLHVAKGGVSATFSGLPKGAFVPFAGGTLAVADLPARPSGHLAFGSARRMTLRSGPASITATRLRLDGSGRRWTLTGRVRGRDMALLTLATSRRFALVASGREASLSGSGFTALLSPQARTELLDAGSPASGLGAPVGGARTARLAISLYGTRFRPEGGLQFDEQPGVRAGTGAAWATATQPDFPRATGPALIRHRGSSITLRALPPTGNGSVTLRNPIVALTPDGGVLTAEVNGGRLEIGLWQRRNETVRTVDTVSRLRVQVRLGATGASALNAQLSLSRPLAQGDPIVVIETLGRGAGR